MLLRNVLASLMAMAAFAPLFVQAQDDVAALIRLAQDYQRQGNIERAKSTYERVIIADPKNVQALLQLGLFNDAAGNREEAIPFYERVVELQPENLPALNNLAYALAELGKDLDRALAMAQLAHQKFPNQADVTDTLGWIYIKKNLGKDAAALYGPVVAMNPKNGAFHYHFGMALLQTGDRVGARQELNLALQSRLSTDDEGKVTELLRTVGR